MKLLAGILGFSFVLGFLWAVGTISSPGAVVMASVVFWLAFGIAGGMVASRKEAQEDGICFGLLFGPLGVIAAGFLDSRPQCSECGSRVNRPYRLCPRCRTELDWSTGHPVSAKVVEAWRKQQSQTPPTTDDSELAAALVRAGNFPPA